MVRTIPISSTVGGGGGGGRRDRDKRGGRRRKEQEGEGMGLRGLYNEVGREHPSIDQRNEFEVKRMFSIETQANSVYRICKIFLLRRKDREQHNL
jgi:hypothetical protein